jgi:Fibronectin type III domain/FG-GAP-like repeat
MRRLCVYLWCVVIVVLGLARGAEAQEQVTLAWDPSPDPEVTGYRVSWGTREGQYTSSIDIGPRTAWTISGLDSIQRYYFTVQAYDATGSLSDRTSPVNNGGLGVQGSGILQDQRPSIFWRHSQTGDLRTWHLSGTSVVDTRSLTINGVPDTNWKIVGTGDLNGDGHTDLVWRNEADGAVAGWLLTNNVVIQTGLLSIPGVTDPAWRVVGVGDTDGDRRADLVWRHSSGLLGTWFMRGLQVVRTSLMNASIIDSNWQIAAVGDINLDGKADLVWRHTDGWIGAWMLNGLNVTATSYFSINRVDLAWRVVAVSRTDALSAPALVWQHDTGGIGLWYVNGPNVLNTSFLNPPMVFDTDWKIVGAR